MKTLLVLAFIGHAVLSGQEPDDHVAGFTVSGYVDAYYSVNLLRPQSRSNQFRNFDIDENRIAFSAAKLSLDRPAEPVGFRLDVFVGPTADIVNSADTVGTLRYVQQIFGTWQAPIGRGLRVDVGKFVTHLGAEVIETPANWTYSRSLLFAYAIPYTHTGIRLVYPVTERVSVLAMAANGWNTVVDNNSGKTFGAQVTWTPTDRLTITPGWIGGPEQDRGSSWRHVVDAVVNFRLSGKLQLGLNGDYGRERIDGNVVVWKGIAMSARLQFTERAAVSLRGEWMSDADGILTGTSQQLKEGTLSLEQRLAERLLVRIEARRDASNRRVFENRRGELTRRDQQTILIGTIFEL